MYIFAILSNLEHLVCGVWYTQSVSGVWYVVPRVCLMCGMWYLVCLWYDVLDMWYMVCLLFVILACGVWCLIFVVSRMNGILDVWYLGCVVSGIWCLAASGVCVCVCGIQHMHFITGGSSDHFFFHFIPLPSSIKEC